MRLPEHKLRPRLLIQTARIRNEKHRNIFLSEMFHRENSWLSSCFGSASLESVVPIPIQWMIQVILNSSHDIIVCS